MSDLEKQELQQKILELEQDIRKLQQNLNDDKNTLKAMKEKLQALKDIAWDRQSKRESSSMYKVLKGEKDYTKVQSDIGRVKVDKDFIEKEIQKHLDDPNLRGMVTKQEMLSFPKVAKNVKPKFDERHRGYNWKALANDGSTLNYGERDWGEGSRLLTAHSETGRGERGYSHRQIYNPDFHNPASDTIIPQNPNKSQISTENSHKIQKIKRR